MALNNKEKTKDSNEVKGLISKRKIESNKYKPQYYFWDEYWNGK